MASRFVVGIDLGTTNSAVAFVDTGGTDEHPPVQLLDVVQVVNPGEPARRPLLPSFLFIPGELDFPAGIGLVGVAVALMGRGHPVGIAVASVLFGVLYQGGAEISFWMPNITRELIMLIQGLVILFAGALSLMFRSSVYSLVDLFRFSKREA